ncbi:hypothetical protein [Acidianus sp. HS-5]|uniref:hypothetical protein n=1 Tax=Acidianus sp. HS-5 TaxID=2886040 RepID=UPI001F38B2DB|nr:hypothetical protein [Acidianus sp. HS-5]BDC19429.1 hypothetical protein HS5_23190 [Acidianus sp. HS-5]
MPWISARGSDKVVYSQCLKLQQGKILRVESFKGDRWIEVKRKGEDEFEITEKGYNNTTYLVNSKDLKALLKRIFEIEFPRSHQVRISMTS